MRPRYPNIILFLILSLVLIAPFALKTIDLRLELFPAAIFPSGATELKLTDPIRFGIRELQGVREDNGQKERIDYNLFFKRIRTHYFPLLADRNFGLDSTTESRIFRTNKLNWTFEEKSKVTDIEREETKAWLRKNLREQGFLDSVLFIVRKRLEIDKQTRELKSTSIMDEKIVKLY